MVAQPHYLPQFLNTCSNSAKTAAKQARPGNKVITDYNLSF